MINTSIFSNSVPKLAREECSIFRAALFDHYCSGKEDPMKFSAVFESVWYAWRHSSFQEMAIQFDHSWKEYHRNLKEGEQNAWF